MERPVLDTAVYEFDFSVFVVALGEIFHLIVFLYSFLIALVARIALSFITGGRLSQPTHLNAKSPPIQPR